MQAREKLKANNAKKRGELDESKLFQDFRTEVGEMNNFVAERKLVREDGRTLSGMGLVTSRPMPRSTRCLRER